MGTQNEGGCASRVARCAALVSKKLRLASRVKRGDACPSLRRVQLMRPPCHCFLYPTTHTEPPAGVLADAQVAAMPTLNFSQRRRFERAAAVQTLWATP